MKGFLKPIYEIITGEFILFENIIGNYIAMGVIGIIAFVIAWNFVGLLYDSKIISGKNIGSFIHWTARLIVFVILFYVSLGIIWIIKNIGIVLFLLSIIGILAIIWNYRKKKNAFLKYIEKELYEIMNSLSASLKIENRNQRYEFERKGILNNGVVFKLESGLISKKIEDSLEEINKKFNEVSKEFNNKLNKKENEYFINKIVSVLNGIIDTYYDEIKKQNEQIMYDGMEEQLGIWKDSLKQNIFSKTKNIFEKMALLNSGKKLEAMVLWGVILSVISVIEGAISIYISLK